MDKAGKQAEKVSPEAQEADCRALAERQGYIVTAVYRDVEKYRVGGKLVEPSGTRADRPGLRAMLAEKQAQEVDAAAVCKDLEGKLDALAFERQKVVTWARKGIISDDDLGTQLAALTFEEAGIRRELADKRLLVGDQAERTTCRRSSDQGVI